MRNYLLYTLLIIMVGMELSCSSGKKLYKNGDYHSAVMQATDRLRRSPNHKKTRETLRKAYPMAVQYYMGEINNAKSSNAPFKFSRVYETYQRLNSLYDAIRTSPGALSVIPNPKSYHNEVREFRNKAAGERYAAGEDQLRLKSRQGAIEAYHHFVKAQEYAPGYLDVENRINEALEIATLKVLVDQVPMPTVNFQLNVEFFQDQIDRFLFNYNDNNFVRFYSPNDGLKEPDQILEVRFDEFSVGNTNNFSASRQLVKDSVVVGQVTMEDGTKKNVIGQVKAEFTENRKEVLSRGLVTMRVLDGRSGRVLNHQKLPGEFIWVSRWASFKGDERALEKEEIEMTKMKPLPPPPPQDLFVEFCRPILGQFQARVSQYYSNI